MKLVYLSNTRFPSERAHSVNIVHMCQSFADYCDEVELCTNNRPTVGESIESYYGLSKQKFLHSKVYAPDVVSLGKYFFIFSTLVFSLLVFMKYRKTTAIIYCRDELVLFVLSFLKSDLRIVYESHEAKWNFASRYLFKRSTPCVVISEGVRDFYLGKGVESSSMMVAHDGIDESFFCIKKGQVYAREKLGLPLDKRIIMYIGGLDTWKGADVFFSAAKYNMDDDIKFVVIGGSSNEISDFRKKYSEITFLGQKPYRNLAVNQKAADILVIPNTATNCLSERYTSPLKLFAHMTSCIPIICSDISSLRNIVNENDVKFFEADNPVSLNSAISDVFDNYERFLRQASIVFQKSKRYTWGERASAICNFISTKY